MDSRSIAHARVEAKRLLKRTNDASFVLPTSLGASLDMIAALKGFPHWHALLASSTPVSDDPRFSPAAPRASAEPAWPVTERLIPSSCWILGRPGCGKWFFLAQQLLDLCRTQGPLLPRVGMVDVGPSASGLVQLLNAGLPPSRRGEALHLPVSPTTRLNPLDLPLGIRRPLGRDRRAKIRWFQAVLDRPDRAFPVPVISDLLDALYEQAQAPGTARRYQPGVIPGIDRLLVDDPWPNDQEASWWDVTDACLELGQPALARRAQRQAVPTLSGLLDPSTLRRCVPARFQASVQEAFAPFAQGWLGEATNVDWDAARMVVLDLDAVCRPGAAPEQRRSALHYLAARLVLGAQAGLADPDERPLLDRALRAQGMTPGALTRCLAWHADQSDGQAGVWSVYDECHRGLPDPTARLHEQIVDDLEAPHRTVVVLSQTLATLTDGPAHARLIDRMAVGVLLDVEDFGQREWTRVVGYPLLGPDAVPATLRSFDHLVRAESVNGRWVGHVVPRTRPSPAVLWGLATGAEDVHLRTETVTALGWVLAIPLLARLFPMGSCRPRLVRMSGPRRARPDAVGTPVDPLVELIDQVWVAHQTGGPLPDLPDQAGVERSVSPA